MHGKRVKLDNLNLQYHLDAFLDYVTGYPVVNIDNCGPCCALYPGDHGTLQY